MQSRILFVEDDPVIRENYADALEEEGFVVESFSNRLSALRRLQEQLPDLVLLDISLGRERDAGFQLCQDVRKLSETVPIVFLTSHEKDIDKISGMRLGADDYLLKDISLDYLVVRIDALLKRFHAVRSTNNEHYDINHIRRGDLLINTETTQVRWKQNLVDLSLTQFTILLELILRPGQVKSASKLMTAANIVVEANTISAHIKAIRKQFRAVESDFDCLRTEYGHGYRWVEPDEG